MTTPTPARGRFIVLEGIDGSGKTTQLEALREWLPTSGLLPPGARVIVSREPGGTALGQALRELLLHPPDGAAPVPRAELLLYAADRAQHVETVLRPAFDAGHWVLCDRYTGSTAAYQGYGRGLSLALIDTLESLATGGLQADLTLWLDVPLIESCWRRREQLADRLEGEGVAFLARVSDGFERLAAQCGWTRINANQPVTAVTAACCRAMLEGFGFIGIEREAPSYAIAQQRISRAQAAGHQPDLFTSAGPAA
jgi:dTMP kinase